MVLSMVSASVTLQILPYLTPDLSIYLNFICFLVENEDHCEFVHLRNFLTRTHLQDLIETTAQIHYEAFRSKQLLAIKESTQQPTTPGSANSPASPINGNAAGSALASPVSAT